MIRIISIFIFVLNALCFSQTNYSIYFDGNTIAIKDTNNWRSGDSQGTISFWVKYDGFQSNFDCFFSTTYENAVERYIRVRQPTTVVAQINERNNDTGTAVAGNTVISSGWHWVCIVSGGTAYTLYVDSVKQTLTITSSNTGDWFADIDARNNVVIGGAKAISELFKFSGWIDEVYIDSTAKNAAWVQSVYEGYLADNQDLTDTTTAVAYWRFDQGTSDVVGTTHLTINGTETYTTDVPFSYPVSNTNLYSNNFTGFPEYPDFINDEAIQ